MTDYFVPTLREELKVDGEIGNVFCYLISLNNMLFKNVAHIGSFKHFVFLYLRICVIVYLCILHLIHGNVIFDILESQ